MYGEKFATVRLHPPPSPEYPYQYDFYFIPHNAIIMGLVLGITCHYRGLLLCDRETVM